MKRRTIKLSVLISSCLLIFSSLLFYDYTSAENKPEFVLKIPVLFPEGSSFMNYAHEWENYVETESKGRIKIVYYSGGVAGDEPDVVRKMRLGQYNGAGMSGNGMSKIAPAVDIIELPILFNSYDEVDYVVEKMMPDFKKLFRDKGYEFLGFVHTGFFYFYTTKPVRTIEDAQALKSEHWSGLRMSHEMMKAFDLQAVPITLPEVLTAVQTGLIELVWASPIVCTSLQWYTQVKYIVNLKVTHGTGGVVITKKYFDSMPKDLQNIVLKGAEIYLPKMVKQTRKDDEIALQGMLDYGLEIIEPTPEIVEEFNKRAKALWDGLADDLYPKSMLDELLGHLEDFRNAKKS